MNRRPVVVGLTGNIGAGKSTVLAYFAQFPEVQILDADKLAHQAMAPGGPAFGPIVEAFGENVVAGDGTIDRRALGEIVFAAPEDLRTLEKITHPAVFQLAQDAISQAEQNGKRIIILEAIKLLDGGSTVKLCDEIWVVTIDSSSQFERLHATRDMDKEAVQQRLDSQSSQEFKMSKATRIIDNSGSLDELHRALAKIWAELIINPNL